MNQPISFISLGPGDSELITIKALKRLQQSDCIFCPMSRGKSRSGDILRELSLDASKIRYYKLPMSKDRQAAQQSYRDVAEQAIALHEQGLRIAITAEGDAGFYSSSQYIKELLAEKGYASERLSGVPAFIDCARLMDMHLVSGQRALEIIPHVEDAARLLDSLSAGKNVVLMKISQSEAPIKEAITRMEGRYQLHYIENLGIADKEYSSCDAESILARSFPYFSILMITQP